MEFFFKSLHSHHNLKVKSLLTKLTQSLKNCHFQPVIFYVKSFLTTLESQKLSFSTSKILLEITFDEFRLSECQKLPFSTCKILRHSVETLGFFCHSDFTWNQFWEYRNCTFAVFAILGALKFANLVNCILQKV